MVELALSTGLAVTTAMFHGFSLLVIGRSLRALDHGRADAELNPLSVSGAAYTSAVVFGLLVLSGIEIWFYAITYAAIGFSDTSLAAHWRLVGAIEGINGVLLLGWSVAFLVAELQRVRHR